jgi:hypothetical protein
VYSWRDDPSVPAFADDRPTLIFDGHCVLCSSFAQFILRHDRERRFRLLAAQTPLGAALYRHLGLLPTEYETNILLEDGRAWFKSEGSDPHLRGPRLPVVADGARPFAAATVARPALWGDRPQSPALVRYARDLLSARAGGRDRFLAWMQILIVGGYGVFGGRIVELLEDEAQLELIVAGRSLEARESLL